MSNEEKTINKNGCFSNLGEDFSGFVNMMRRDQEKKRLEMEEFNKCLRDPDYSCEIEDGFVLGYWRVPEGIYVSVDYGKGHIPWDGRLIKEAELKVFVELFSREARTLKK